MEVYATLMKAFSRAMMPRECEDTLRDMRNRGLVPNIVAYTTAVSSWAACGDVAAAERLVKIMSDQGMQPNRVTYLVRTSGLDTQDGMLETQSES